MKPLLIGMLIARLGGDMTTSRLGFNQGATERNPLVVSTKPGVFEAQMIGEAAIQAWLLKRLERSHPKLAKALAFVQIGVSTSATAFNIRELR